VATCRKLGPPNADKNGGPNWRCGQRGSLHIRASGGWPQAGNGCQVRPRAPRKAMSQMERPTQLRGALVLGGGFLGSHIAHRFRQSGPDVTVVTRSEPRGHAAALVDDCHLLIGDIRDAALLPQLAHAVDDVIYAVGTLHPQASNSDPITDVSTALIPLLATLTHLDPGVTFTFLSSGGTVYGDAVTTPTPEDAPTEPVSSYGIMKLAGEKYTLLYQRLRQLRSRIVRIGNVYGPGQPYNRGQGVMGTLFDCAVSGRPLEVFGDGSFIRDYIHVDDMADAIVRLLDAPPEPSVVNIGTGIGTSISEAIDVVRAVSGEPIAVEYLPTRSVDVRRSVLDTRRLRDLISFHPRSLTDGVASTWLACHQEELLPNISRPHVPPAVPSLSID